MATELKWPDYLILVCFLVISVGIGFYHSLTGGRQKTTTEFIMADRRLKVLPTAISLLVSFQSAIAMLGLSSETYCYGIQYLIFAAIISSMLGMLIVGRIFIPLFYPLKLISINEYLERRYFSRSVRVFAATLGILATTMYMGATLFVTSAALESATGLSLKISIPLMAFVAVTYTALGGMRAVIWTDVFQFVIMIGGLLAIFIKGLMSVGGISNVFILAEREGRLDWIDVSPDPRVRHTIWGLLIAMTTAYVHMYGLSQASVQRYSAIEKLSKAKLTVLINLPPLVIMNTINSLMGLIVLAYYSKIKCDPVANNDVKNPNQLLPFFVFSIFADAPGFAGVFLATLYGASLSTLSTSLSGTAANIWEDILQWKLARLTESRKALINRFLVVFLGAVAYGVAFLSAFVPGPITQVVGVMVSSAAGPVLGIFLLGAVSKHANWKGALVGGFSGLAFGLWLSIGSMIQARKQPFLPPVSVDGCNSVNDSLTFGSSFNYSSSELFQATETIYQNYTQEPFIYRAISQHDMDELHGIQNFYAISYVWFGAFSAILTILVGLTASFATRDKELEDRVEDCMLIRFRSIFEFDCGKDEDENVDDVDDEKISLNETHHTNETPPEDNDSSRKIKKDKFRDTEIKENENGLAEKLLA